METFGSAIGLLKEKLTSWLEQAILLFPNFVISLTVIIVMYFLSILVGKTVHKVFNRFLNNLSLVKFLAILSRILVMIFGLIIALQILQLDQAVTSLLTGVGIVGIVLGFAFQDMASNLFSGIALVFRDDRPFKLGDIVHTQDIMGIVREINLRSTTIETFTGQWVFIPNKQIFENPVTNYTMLGRRRIDLVVGISYGDNLEKVKEVSLNAINDIDSIERHHPVDLYFKEFGNSSINFILRFWIKFTRQPEYLAARSNAMINIKKAFDENDITIPFPIRTLDFGIKGGATLAEMLPDKPD